MIPYGSTNLTYMPYKTTENDMFPNEIIFKQKSKAEICYR